MRPSVEVGKLVPDFSAKSSSGNELKLSDYKGRTVVLYFYPKDNTPGCTLEGQDFNSLYARFDAAGAVILGVSKDSVQSHCKFIEKFGFKFELLSDEDTELCKLFGVFKEKSLYGRKFMGIERSTFIIDRSGILAAEYRQVKVAGHAQEVLEKVKSL